MKRTRTTDPRPFVLFAAGVFVLALAGLVAVRWDGPKVLGLGALALAVASAVLAYVVYEVVDVAKTWFRRDAEAEYFDDGP